MFCLLWGVKTPMMRIRYHPRTWTPPSRRVPLAITCPKVLNTVAPWNDDSATRPWLNKHQEHLYYQTFLYSGVRLSEEADRQSECRPEARCKWNTFHQVCEALRLKDILPPNSISFSPDYNTKRCIDHRMQRLPGLTAKAAENWTAFYCFCTQFAFFLFLLIYIIINQLQPIIAVSF